MNLRSSLLLIGTDIYCKQYLTEHRRTGTFGLGRVGGGDFPARKNYAMPERVEVEIGMQTQTITIFSSNELLSLKK